MVALLRLTFSHNFSTRTHVQRVHMYDTYIRVRALFLLSVHTKILSFTIQPPTPCSPCMETWYGIRDTETDSLQLYWPPLLLHLLPSSSSPSCRPAGWVLRLTAAPTANQSAALPAPVIGFPRFSQLFLKSHATLFFPVFAPLSFNRVARARVASRKALFEEQSAGE